MCNLSIFGQLARITIGLTLIIIAWFGPQTSILSFEWMVLWKLGWLGFIPLFSGIAAFCPVYAILGHDHQQKHSQPQKHR
jgi:hypothetical protein